MIHKPCYMMIHCGIERVMRQLRCCDCDTKCVYKAYDIMWENCKYGAQSDYHNALVWDRLCEFPELSAGERLRLYCTKAMLYDWGSTEDNSGICTYGEVDDDDDDDYDDDDDDDYDYDDDDY